MQSRNIIKLDKYTMRNKTEKETGVSFMSGELTFGMIYNAMKLIDGPRPMMEIADSFIDYMFDDVNRGLFYIHVNKYEYSGAFKSLESEYYKDIKEKERYIMTQYDNNPYFYIREYFSDIDRLRDDEWQSAKTELNKFLKRLGFKIGTVGEKHFSYYVSDVRNSDLFIQDLYYDENFCSAVFVDEVTGEEHTLLEEIHIERDIEFISIVYMLTAVKLSDKKLFNNGEIFLVDNYFAEQFDDVRKVREVITKEYLLLR